VTYCSKSEKNTFECIITQPVNILIRKYLENRGGGVGELSKHAKSQSLPPQD
jgi:hypothetical protein